MKSKLNFFAGLIAGILIVTCTGMASAISESVTAVLTTSPIYLDGEQVALKGYNIAGHNYFQLRDIGEHLGFNVYWADGAVFIDSQSPYTGVASNKSELDQVRQDIINRVNEIRTQNGLTELSVNQALMSAAQECANRKYTWHHNREECEAVANEGYPYGFGSNLTVFTSAAVSDIAQRAVNNWVNSPGHYQAMLKESSDSIGVGVYVDQGVTYCYLFVGNPKSHNPYG